MSHKTQELLTALTCKYALRANMQLPMCCIFCCAQMQSPHQHGLKSCASAGRESGWTPARSTIAALVKLASVFAETSVQLQALEKISHEHPAACLRHGGLLASLSYLDFFQTGVQRVAVATAANMCRSVTSENTDAVASAIPMLTNLLQYQVDINVACITSFSGMCEGLCTPGRTL